MIIKHNKKPGKEEIRNWLTNLIESEKGVVVEGINDKRALATLGVAEERIHTLNKKALFEHVEIIAKDYREIIILTDLDREGRLLYSKLKEEFEELRVGKMGSPGDFEGRKEVLLEELGVTVKESAEAADQGVVKEMFGAQFVTKEGSDRKIPVEELKLKGVATLVGVKEPNMKNPAELTEAEIVAEVRRRIGR